MRDKSCCNFFSCLREPSNSSSCNKNFSWVRRKALVGRELCLFVCLFWFWFFGLSPDSSLMQKRECVGGLWWEQCGRYVIYITAGVYNEVVRIPKDKTNLMFIGDGVGNTIITGNMSVALIPGMITWLTPTVGKLGHQNISILLP